jgi:hypothetical protein
MMPPILFFPHYIKKILHFSIEQINIVHPNTNMAYSKVLLDPILGNYLRRRDQLTSIFFDMTRKEVLKDYFQRLWEML